MNPARLSLVWILIPCFTIALHGAHAEAQDTVRAENPAPQSDSAESDDARFEEARTSFARGLAEAERAQWVAAAESFRRAYTLTHAPVALLNLAESLRTLGRVVEARDAFANVLADVTIDAPTRAEATQGLAAATDAIAHLMLRRVPSGDVVLRVDGVERTTMSRERDTLSVELDPGTHALELECGTQGLWRRTVQSRFGVQESIDVVLPRAAETSRWWQSPWLWTGVGVLVLAGATTGIAVWANTDAQLDPRTDTFALRF